MTPLPAPSRREFLTQSLPAGLGLAAAALLSRPLLRAVEPIRREGAPRFRTSLVGYSFRKYFTAKDPAHRLTLFQLIDYCADQGFDGVELTGYYLEEPTTPEYLHQLKRHAYLRGVAISGTSVGNRFAIGRADRAQLKPQIALVKAGIDHAAALGAPYLRVFAGRAAAMTVDGAFESCVASFEECADYAGRQGVFIALENDAGLTPDSTLALLQAVKNPWFALNLDLGNFHTADVYADCARCAPYAVNVHFKKEVIAQGKAAVPADIPRFLSILKDAKYQGFLGMEFEASGDPYEEIPGWKRQLDSALAS